MTDPVPLGHSSATHRRPPQPTWFRLMEGLSSHVVWLIVVVGSISLVALLAIALLDGPGRHIDTLTDVRDQVAVLH